MNYTKPENPDYEDKPEDWLFCAMVYSAALGTVLKENQGIFIKLKGDELKLHPTSTNVIVWHNGNQISIIDARERTDLKEGDWIHVIPSKNIEN